MPTTALVPAKMEAAALVQTAYLLRGGPVRNPNLTHDEWMVKVCTTMRRSDGRRKDTMGRTISDPGKRYCMYKFLAQMLGIVRTLTPQPCL